MTCTHTAAAYLSIAVTYLAATLAYLGNKDKKADHSKKYFLENVKSPN